jgi:hypothetical protein
MVRRLVLMLAFFCALEVFIHLTDGTNPNVRFPWGHYPETIAGFGVVMLLVGYSLRERTGPTQP